MIPRSVKLQLLVVFSRPPEILPARGARLNKKNLNVFLKKLIPRSVKLQFGVQKSKCGANRRRIGQSRLVCKLYHCTKYYLSRSYQLEVQDQIKKN